jgi:beta-1,4-mannosyltransferase
MHAVREGSTPPEFIKQIAEHSPSDVHHEYMSIRNILSGHFDVLHVHWPEIMVRAERPYIRYMRLVAFMVFVLSLRIRNTPIVRTIHNLEPHEKGPRWEAAVLKILDRMTTLYVVMNRSTPVRQDADSVLIPHGHFRNQFAQYERPSRVEGRLLYFGYIRPYKGIQELISVFSEVEDETMSLRIVGKPYSEKLKRLIETASITDKRISAELKYVTDEQTLYEFSKAELVVLPYLEAANNSGVVLLALSLGRPVLVRSSPVNEELSAEVGPGWVFQFDGLLTSEILTKTLEQVRLFSLKASAGPKFSQRDLQTIAKSYAEVYKRVSR